MTEMSKADAIFGWIIIWSVSRWSGRIHFLCFWSQEEASSVDKFLKKQKLLIALKSSVAISNVLSISIWWQKLFPCCSGIWYRLEFVLTKGLRADWDHLALLPVTRNMRVLGSSCEGCYWASSSELSELDAGIHQWAKCRSWGITFPQYNHRMTAFEIEEETILLHAF